MWPESDESPRPLRTGLTTGSCATACCVAAVQALLGKVHPQSVDILLPRGQQVNLSILDYQEREGQITTRTRKDAGDDPDVTHHAVIVVTLTLCPVSGVRFEAGSGVGTVTRTGLALAIGEPAINPVPRKMMMEHLQKYAEFYGYTGGFIVRVGVEEGEALAQKTMNPRLGIVGGLSILGTTGIVRPYSCSAYIASIRQGVDVANANGLTHIAASTGSSSENCIRAHYALPDMALIEMGDFAGALLKHLKKTLRTKSSIHKLTLCGGFGKLTKLANGHMDLHSRSSSVDFVWLAQVAAELGADETLRAQILQANTSIEVLNLCRAEQLPLADRICQLALVEVRRWLPESVIAEVWAINRQGNRIGVAA